MIRRGYRYELKPTAAQAAVFGQWFGVVRSVFNAALEQRRDFWRQYLLQTGRHITFASQSRELTDLRRASDWVAEAPRIALEAALKDLERAYTAFFAGRASYPNFRAKGQSDTMRFKAGDLAFRKLNAKWSAIRFPKLGWVKYRDSRALAGRPVSVTVTRSAGRWFVAVGQQIETAIIAGELPAVGIDRGIAQTLTLSTGEAIQAPDMAAMRRRTARAQRVLARRKCGSKRHAKQAQRVARLRAQAARQRSDWCHRASTSIARRFGLVAIEDLKIASMTVSARGTMEAPGKGVRQKAGLNRSILEQCWGRFASHLDYKLAERGGHLVSVPVQFTSQTCSACGVVDARSRKSQAVFACVHCDHVANADHNAAIEILRRSTSGLGVEGSHFEPAEALIMVANAA